MTAGLGNNFYNPYNPYGFYGNQNQQYKPTFTGNTLLEKTYYNPITLTGGVSVNEPPAEHEPTAAEIATAATDGKDDGKIGFWKATGNFLKGAVKFVTSPFTDEQGNFSLGKTLKSVAIGALFVAGNVLTGGALTPVLLAAGGAMGAIGMAKAGYNIATAQTDAEAEAAWQSMGSSTATVAATVIGAKSYAKAKGIDTSGIKGTGRAIKQTYSDAWANTKAGAGYVKDSVAGLADMTPSEVGAAVKNGYNTAKNTATGAYDAAKGYVKGKYDAIKGESISDTLKAGADVVKGKVSAAYDSVKDTTFREMLAKVTDLAKNAAATAKQNGPGIKSTIAGYAKDPFVIGSYAVLARQTVKPDFYGSLSPIEQQYFDNLPAEQKEMILEAYYEVV